MEERFSYKLISEQRKERLMNKCLNGIKIYFWLVLVGFMPELSYGQFTGDNTSERGKCYGQSIYEDLYETKEEVYCRFVGELSDSTLAVEEVAIKADFIDPYYIHVVVDTFVNKEFIIDRYKYEVLVEKSYSMWKEVICSVDLTSEILNRIEELLSIHGFFEENLVDDTWDSQSNSALIAFQRFNNLPIGSIDIETLKLLGLEKKYLEGKKN